MAREESKFEWQKSMKLLREKAIEIFAEYGYFQTKISDIVKAANVTQPTFYLYFESKDVLYKEIITDFQTNLEKIIDESVSESNALQNSKETIHVILNRMFNYFSLNPDLTKVGLFESDVPTASKILSQKLKSVVEKDSRFIDEDDIVLHIFIESLIGSIERLTLSALLSEKVESKKLAEEIVNIYFAKEKSVVTA
ncbi:TetR family transcriptional regulator OS=Ureibacillus acetophenoni OX=614649 GN=SAMN05877842_101148 PE=4 SV=1 [Ureibacillus acetophenoni]